MKWSEEVTSLATRIQSALPKGARPSMAIVLGSGLNPYAETFENPVRFGYGSLGIPCSGIVGHHNQLIYAKKHGVELILMQGRPHRYEGFSMQNVVLPIRALVKLGCRTIVLTNSAGGIQRGLTPGQFVLIEDQINFMGESPLEGANDPILGTRFPDMSAIYDRELIRMLKQSAKKARLCIGGGVYIGVRGPQYETPAEIQAFARMGADVVGMSTVPEAIAAHHMGARVAGISCVSNLAAGLSPAPLTHDEVTETANDVQQDFTALVDGLLEAMGASSNTAKHRH